MKNQATTLILTLALSGAIVSPALAKEYKGKGVNEYDVVSSAPVGGEDSGKVRLQYKGTIQQEGEASPVTGNQQTCTGLFTVDEKGAATAGSGYCDGVDADGDVWTLHFTAKEGKGKWEFSWGTGKFAGTTGGGTTETLPTSGENKLKFAWEGAWNMK